VLGDEDPKNMVDAVLCPKRSERSGESRKLYEERGDDERMNT